MNNSRWANFRTWRTARWRHRAGPTAIALLGDAAHTAHFSVGSGTKMAMEDAVALVAALDQHASGSRPDRDAVDAALATYEAARRPQVTRIQDAARPSLSWWEHFGRSYRALPPWQFAYTSSAGRCRSRSSASVTRPSLRPYTKRGEPHTAVPPIRCIPRSTSRADRNPTG